MLDPIVNFFVRVFNLIGQGIGWCIAMMLWPFVAFSRWYTKRGWVLKSVFGLIILLIVASYVYLFSITQFWSGFDRDYARVYVTEAGSPSAGDTITSTTGGTKQCQPSNIVRATADLIDFNVNQNTWIPSTVFSKLGFFGIPWKNTPYFDNKAAFQLGINKALRRTSIELVDRLGRVRGTSGINQNLQDARTSLAYDEDSWFFSMDPFGFRTTTQSNYRRAQERLAAFNQELQTCVTNFDARPDNLLEFFDRITKDIGSTSDILRTRMEASNMGWLDPRADDRFWFAYGELYAYSGILAAARADFSEVVSTRNLEQLWVRTEDQLRSALNLTPGIISNGHEASWIMPTHLATMGFYILRVRANLVEMRDVLDR
ncbi:MAG: DUF2333 family protein [Rhizobiaceae bacterium]|nr:DUF2333 family protein [Rhizobiaceae bacterium]